MNTNEEMKTLSVLPVCGRRHVVKRIERTGVLKYKVKGTSRMFTTLIPQPNYRGTGLALCGILLRGETLQEWIIRTKN